MITGKAMKKMSRKSLMLLIAALFICTAAAQAQAGSSALLAKKEGNVEVKLPGKSWSEARMGESLAQGAEIRTSAGATAFVKWANGDVIKIGPLSQVVLSKMQQSGNTRNREISLNEGKAFAKVKKLATGESTFTIRTPTAIAGVRGTGFQGSFIPGRGAQFTVLSGTIAVEAEGVIVEVAEGMTSMVNLGEPPMPPEPAPPAVIDNLKSDDTEAEEVTEQPEPVAPAEEKVEEELQEETEEVVEQTVENVDDDVEQVIQNEIEQTAVEEGMNEAGTLIINIE